MLEALPTATAAGQKAQEDSRLGQGSIFDLGGGERRARAARGRAQHPPIGLDEFDQRELLRLEKETLGTFLSSHPLAEVRDALRARVDCSLSELGEQGRTARSSRVGGIVTEFKRHKTKRGDPMAFATLDDVEGQVEMLVLGKAYDELGRVRSASTASCSSGAGSTTRSAARPSSSSRRSSAFEPTRGRGRARARSARAPKPIVLRIDAGEPSAPRWSTSSRRSSSTSPARPR